MTNARPNPDPDEIEVLAIDIIPYRVGIWCTIAGGEPFVNPIVHRAWSEDGTKIWFMLDSHNFYSAKPFDTVKVVPSTCRHKHATDPRQWDTAAFVAARPSPPKPKCSHCDGSGTEP